MTVVEAAAEVTKAANENAAAENTKAALTTPAMANENAKDPRLHQFTKKGEQELQQNGRNKLRLSSTSQEADGLPRENGTIHIRSTGTDIITRMDTTCKARLMIVEIARKSEEKTQLKAIIRLQLAPTEKDVASNSNRCEKGQGQTMC